MLSVCWGAEKALVAAGYRFLTNGENHMAERLSIPATENDQRCGQAEECVYSFPLFLMISFPLQFSGIPGKSYIFAAVSFNTTMAS